MCRRQNFLLVAYLCSKVFFFTYIYICIYIYIYIYYMPNVADYNLHFLSHCKNCFCSCLLSHIYSVKQKCPKTSLWVQSLVPILGVKVINFFFAWIHIFSFCFLTVMCIGLFAYAFPWASMRQANVKMFVYSYSGFVKFYEKYAFLRKLTHFLRV